MNNATLGERIATQRQVKGLNKAALARLVGVSDVAIGYWESGEIRQIGHEHLLKLAKALDTSVSELLDDPGLRGYTAEVYSDAAGLVHNKIDADLLYKESRRLYEEMSDA